MRREWYVYWPRHKLVLSGYSTFDDARLEAGRVELEVKEKMEVMPEYDPRIKEYALTHPDWAKREGFEASGPTFKQEVSPHVCPACGEAVAGGPEEYLGHIRTEHPEEWRRLETDPGYTLMPVGATPPAYTYKPSTPITSITEEERVREVAVWTLDLLREKGPMTDQEISAQLDVPLDRVSRATDKLMREGKIEWRPLAGKYSIATFPKSRLPVEAGILRCRFCGAPYAYRENLELHERGCPRRIGY